MSSEDDDRGRVRLRRSRWLLAAVSCLGVVLFTIPGHLGLWAVYPFTQLSAMRMLTALGIAVGALGCILWALGTRRGTLLRPSVVTALVSLGCVGLVAGSLVRDGALREDVPDPDAASDLVVMSFNAKDTTARDVAAAAEEHEADAVLLVEAPADVVEEVAERLDGATAFTNATDATSSFDAVGVVVRDRLGTYEQVPGPSLQLGSVAIEGGAHGPRHLAAVHPPPPVQRYAPAARWREQVREAVAWCERQDGAVVGGDFNAVADHLRRSGLERCASATEELGVSARGTWPVELPAWLGAGIDHQLVDPGAWTPVGARVVAVGVSDHRAVVVSYRRA